MQYTQVFVHEHIDMHLNLIGGAHKFVGRAFSLFISDRILLNEAKNKNNFNQPNANNGFAERQLSVSIIFKKYTREQKGVVIAIFFFVY